MHDVDIDQLTDAERRALLAGLLRKRRAAGTENLASPRSVLLPNAGSRYEPFPLTEVQRAYWVGRSASFELGGVGCHAYIEYDLAGLDRELLESAWQKLVHRHDMLRAVVREDGLQHILPAVPRYKIEHRDLRGVEEQHARRELEMIRLRMSHHVFPPDRWPLFELRTTQLEQQLLLHMSLDLLPVDFWSIQILISEWIQLALDPALQLPPLQISFRDYVLATRPTPDCEGYRRAQEYWQQRLPSLPPPPKLPLAKPPSGVMRPQFKRWHATLEPALWRGFKDRSARAGVTPSAALMAAFARVLATWSQSGKFTLTLTLFERLPLHPQVDRLVGDFTSIILVEVNAETSVSFETIANRVATQLWNDFEHREFSGVRALQDLAKRQGRPVSIPVVFTSALAHTMPGMEMLESRGGGFDKVVYSVSQTPQVWLDHQVYEHAGSLHYNWDAVEELFPPHLLDDIFATYRGYLRRLAGDDAAWTETHISLVPEAQLAQRAAINDTAAPVSVDLLHAPFLEQAGLRPQHTAIIAADRRLSYEEVSRRARTLARQLRRMGCAPNRLVAIVMEKGWEQVVAAVAILEAGGAYLPIEPDLPKARLWMLLERGEVNIALTQSCISARLEWPACVRCVSVDQTTVDECDGLDEPLERYAHCEDLAYVIFTSGSTGEPKGVMIEHGSALNTVLDINERFAIGPDDRVLALSSLGFDLSVYDIFGALAAGATIVLPHAISSRDPGDWASLVLRERVTIWNSVPALLQMLLDCVGSRKELLGNSLRLALLSGDWIPLGLPDSARDLMERCHIVSLGGATEASIWSIFYPIGAIDPQWSSIPYGGPLRNQQMHVLNETMQPCPTWVQGHLYIGGIGLARGYWRDEAQTSAQFVRHSQTGERLYRTGDMGRYLPDGTVEFLGREDEQVKVQGYRIELREIESVLERHPAVHNAAVVVQGERAAPKRLVAYIVTDGISVEQLSDYARELLPGYMVPGEWHKVESLPLNANGKVNRRALPAITGASHTAGAPSVNGMDLRAQIAALVAEELGHALPDHDQNLLAVGATSLDLVRTVGRLEKKFGFRPSFKDFLQEPTVAALARLVEQHRERVALQRSGDATWRSGTAGSFELIIDPDAREAFRLESRGIREFGDGWGALVLEREQSAADLSERVPRRRATRRFLPDPVPLASLGAWLAELSQMRQDGGVKYAYGSAGSCYAVQTYLYAKHGGISGCGAGTFYYHPIKHCLVPLTLGRELDPAIHDPFINRPIFERARFSLFFVSQPGAIEPMYGELAWRFSLIEAGAMAHALECSAWRFGLGVCPIGMLDFAAVRPLFHLDEGQELLHAHVGGLVEPADWEEGVV
jgi:amino acid adenylation domain-containing protein